MYVWHGYKSKFHSTVINAHTMATPFPLSFEIAVCSRSELLIWAAFLIFLVGLMRVIKNSVTRKMSFAVVETCRFFIQLLETYRAMLWFSWAKVKTTTG